MTTSAGRSPFGMGEFLLRSCIVDLLEPLRAVHTWLWSASAEGEYPVCSGTKSPNSESRIPTEVGGRDWDEESGVPAGGEV